MKNKKGVANVFFGVGVLIVAIMGRATVETSKSGVLQNNGKRIWCKALNKGAEYCEQTYSSNPMVRGNLTSSMLETEK